MLSWCAFYLTDDFHEIHGSMNNYVTTGNTKTPTRGRGQSQTKRNSRYLEDNVENPTVVSINSAQSYLLCTRDNLYSSRGY